MSSRYELKENKGQYWWTLQADNNENLLTSEMYVTKGGAENGIASAKTNSPFDSRYYRGAATNGQFFFTLSAENHEKLGTSETYKTTAAREQGIAVVKKVGPLAPVVDLTKKPTGAFR